MQRSSVSLVVNLAEDVVNKLVEQGFTSSRSHTVEDIQDIVESPSCVLHLESNAIRNLQTKVK